MIYDNVTDLAITLTNNLCDICPLSIY